MRKKIEFIGRSWEFPLGRNGGGMLIKTKKYDKMRREQKQEGERARIFFKNLKRISEESEGEGEEQERSDGVVQVKMNNTGD